MAEKNQKTDTAPAADQQIADLQQAVADMQKAFAQLSKENNALKEQVQKSADPAKAPEPPRLPANNTFEVDGKSYTFLAPAFLYDGKTVTAVDALADDAILADLVAKGSGVIKELA